MNRTIWQDCFAFLVFFFTMGNFFDKPFYSENEKLSIPFNKLLDQFQSFLRKWQRKQNANVFRHWTKNWIFKWWNPGRGKFWFELFPTKVNIRFQVFWKAHINLTKLGPNLTPEYFRNISFISTSLLAPYNFCKFGTKIAKISFSW